MEKLTFEVWWQRVMHLCDQKDWGYGDPESWREYYDDGDSPEDAVATEIKYAKDDAEAGW